MRQAVMSQDLLQMNNNDETPTDDSGDNKKMKMLFNEVWLRSLDDAFCDLQIKIVGIAKYTSDIVVYYSCHYFHTLKFFNMS